MCTLCSRRSLRSQAKDLTRDASARARSAVVAGGQAPADWVVVPAGGHLEFGSGGVVDDPSQQLRATVGLVASVPLASAGSQGPEGVVGATTLQCLCTRSFPCLVHVEGKGVEKFVAVVGNVVARRKSGAARTVLLRRWREPHIGSALPQVPLNQVYLPSITIPFFFN